MSCGGGGSGGGTNTVVQNSQPPANVQAAYSALTGAAFNQAQQPQQQYTGPLVAGFTPQQTQAFGEIQNAQGMATPYINAAAQEFGQATTPFYQTVGSYESPYTGQVTNALTGLFNQQNAQQQQQVNSNATAQGAFGGDRSAVANALTAQQQNLSEAPTLANVLQGGYQTALGAAESQGWLGEQGGFGLGNLGTEAEGQALTGANAELSSGGLQQQLAQEQLNIPYEQFQSEQAYPWQTLGALSPIVSGTGSLSGGTSSTAYPGPSLVSQLGGLGVAGLGTYGLLNSTGAFGNSGYLSGLFGGAGTGAAGADLGSLAALPELGGIGSATDFIGGAGALGLLGAAKRGGRIGFADGGGIGGTSSASEASLPPVPTVNLDYLVAPGPLTKGSGPPKAPQGNPEQMQGQSPVQEMQMFEGIDKLAGQAGIGGEGSAFGGRTHRQDGGTSALGTEETTNAPLQDMPPMQQGFVQKLQTLPMDQLRAMAARMPQNSPYGQIVQRVLTSRRITPSAAPSQVSSASGVPIGTGIGQVPGIGGNQQQPQGQQQGQGQGYAAGGGPVIQEEPDMDPHPVVDHSGDTVVVHYGSEGKSLDLGIPSAKSRRTLAAGGAGGGPSVIGSGAATAQPFFSSFTAGNGVEIPQLSMDAFAAPGGPSAMVPTAGGGLGNWYNPLPQLTGSWQQQPIMPFAGYLREGGRARFDAGGNEDEGALALDNSGFGSEDLGPPAAVVTPAGGMTAPGPSPAPAAAAPPSKTEPEPEPSSGTDFVPTPPHIQGLYNRESGGDYTAQNPTSTASGAGQDVDATFHEATRALGYGDQWAHAKQAPHDVQNAVNIWLQGRYGDKPWRSSDPAYRGRGIGSGTEQPPIGLLPSMRAVDDGGDTIVPPGGGIGGGGGIGEPYGGAGAALMPPATSPSAWTQNPWMIPIAIGAGMMSGRSPHALVNVGQGLTEGIKTAETQGEQGTRAAALENEAANRQATLGIEAQRLRQQGAYQQGELGIRQNEFGRQMKAEQDRFDIEMTNAKTTQARAEAADQHYQNMDAINAAYKQMMMAKPLPGFDRDPTTGQMTYGTHQFNPDTGRFEFHPGAGEGRAPSAATNTFEAKRQAWLSVHKGDDQGALAFAGGTKQMTPEEINRSAANLAQHQMASDPTSMALSPEEQQQRIGQYTRFYVGQIQNGGAGPQHPAAATPAAATNPAPATRQTAPAGPPPVPAALSGVQLRGWSPSTQKFYGVDGRAYDASGQPAPTFEAKRQAWLSVHKGDDQGALAFAGGTKQMTPEEINRSAANLAQHQMASDPTSMALSPEEQQQRIGQYTRFYVGQIQNGGAGPQHPAAATPAAATNPAPATRQTAPAGPP